MLLVTFGVLFSLVTRYSEAIGGNSCAVDPNSRERCGFISIGKDSCESKGCCWDMQLNVDVPSCFSPQKVAGYSLSKLLNTATGYQGELELIGGGNANYGQDISKLSIDIIFESVDIIHVKINDVQATRWEIPQNIIDRPHAKVRAIDPNYDIKIEHVPFTFEVTRKSDGRSLFKFDSTFLFKDQYIEFSTSIDKSAKTFGIGESTRLHHALEPNTTYTLWAADIPAMILKQNLYGAYPYYVQVVNGTAHGAMLLNSNGMDVELRDESITFKTIGGIVDLYVFTGSTPAQVVDQYTQIVGRPAMMPYWSLGFHNCRWGYENLQQVKDVVANYSAAKIPLDTQWFDIDYMQEYRDFTLDSKNFPQADVATFVNNLHNNGQHFVPIIDPGIMVYPGYDAYEEGKKLDLFMKDLSGGYYMGQVWPGPTVFPDFFHPATQDYWTEQLKKFHDMAAYDGIWIDMNEISNFCNKNGEGQVCVNSSPDGCPVPGASRTDCCLVCTMVDSTNKYDFPPYHIGNTYGRLSTRTISMSNTLYDNNVVYNTHNIYGLTEQIATNKAITQIRGKRPFVLSRSSFVSTGVHSAKWTGDNGATWGNLKSSVVSIMDFNLFGVPMIGADICGFMLNTTEELCARWIEVGAFYPFSRAHNTVGTKPQELYLWDSVAAAARYALGMRYQIIPYLYTLFYHAHTSGDMVARALWVNYPSDGETVTINRQFMLGKGILVSPVLDEGETSVNAYFPQDLWYSFPDRTLAIDASNGGLWKTLSTPLTSTNVHVRGGTILPLQDAAMTTTEGRKTPFTLLAALCPYGKAFGDLFWDDGEQISLDNYLTVSYEVNTSGSSGSLVGTVNHNSYLLASSNTVQTVTILGKSLVSPSSATLNGASLSSSQISFDATKNSITFSNLNLKLNENIALQWN